MKKNTIKNCLITALSFAFVGFAGVATLTATADTEGQTVTSLAEVELEMVAGASIRVDNDAVSGIRFSAKMDLNELAWLENNYDTVKFGTFIMPAEYATTYGALTETNLFGSEAKYFWDGKAEVGEQTEILQMYGAMYEYTDEEGNTYGRVNGSILEVNPANYNRAFVGLSYMELTKGTEVTYKLATANDNERTILYVAQRALEREGWETTDARYTNTANFIQAYVTANPSAEVKYTVNKTFQQKDGSWKTETEERTAPFNSVVELDEVEEAEAYYYIAKGESTMKGTAYAQDKLVLSLTYGFRIEDEVMALMGIDGNSAYAFEYFPEQDRRVMLVQNNWIRIKIQPAYIAKALQNGAKQLALSFGNNEGTGFGFDATEMPVGATENGIGLITIPLDANTDYSAGLIVRFYQHDGVNPCKGVWFAIEQKASLSIWYNGKAVAYQGNNSWLVEKDNDSVGLLVSKEYIQSWIAKGAKGISIKFENKDGTGFNMNGRVSTETGAITDYGVNSSVSTFDSKEAVWTIDFTKYIDGTATYTFDCGWDGVGVYEGVAYYGYIYNGNNSARCKKLLLTVTAIYE